MSADGVEDAMAAHTGLNPATEAYAAAICFHAEALEAALSVTNGGSATTSSAR